MDNTENNKFENFEEPAFLEEQENVKELETLDGSADTSEEELDNEATEESDYSAKDSSDSNSNEDKANSRVTMPPLPENVDHDTLCAALDAILLVNNKPITYEKLSMVLGITMEETEQLVLERRRNYEENPRCGLQIAIIETGVQLATKAKISQFIQRLDGQKMVSLSIPALETLSVIAYKQPITKAEIEAIRGVNSDGVVSTLLEKKLIYISGEKAVIGRPRLYSTTQDFLYYFGMSSLKELPTPTLDITDALTPEGQKAEAVEEKKEVEKDFNASQGFVPIEGNDNIEKGEVSESEEDPQISQEMLSGETAMTDAEITTEPNITTGE